MASFTLHNYFDIYPCSRSNILFVFIFKQYCIIWIYQHLFIHSLLMDIWFISSFNYTNKAEMNIRVQVFMRTYTFISLGNIPKNRMVDHVLGSRLKFEETAKLFLKVLVKILRSHQ